MEGLAPDKNMNLNKKVRADGLTFAQYMIGDLVLNCHVPAGTLDDGRGAQFGVCVPTQVEGGQYFDGFDRDA